MVAGDGEGNGETIEGAVGGPWWACRLAGSGVGYVGRGWMQVVRAAD